MRYLVLAQHPDHIAWAGAVTSVLTFNLAIGFGL